MLLFDILAGFFLGFCYDLFKAFRNRTDNRILRWLLDLLFWWVVLLLCVWLFLLTGDQKLRYYELFALGSGFSCYFWSISSYFVKISEKIADYFLLFFKIPFTILKFFAIMIKNGVLFLLMPIVRLIRFGKKRTSAGIIKLKQHWKLMKRI